MSNHIGKAKPMERLVLSASKDEAKQPFFPKSDKMTKVLLSTTSPRKCNFLYFFFSKRPGYMNSKLLKLFYVYFI